MNFWSSALDDLEKIIYEKMSPKLSHFLLRFRFSTGSLVVQSLAIGYLPVDRRLGLTLLVNLRLYLARH